MKIKTLYVTDLDGTLLGETGMPSPFTTKAIRGIIGNGGLFSVATGRCPQSAEPAVRELGVSIPGAYTNGVTIYDPVGERILESTSLPEDAPQKLEEIISRHDCCGFLYAPDGNKEKVYYTGIRHDEEQFYYNKRFSIHKGQIFHEPNLVHAAKTCGALYMVVYGNRSRIRGVWEEARAIPGLLCKLYENVYTGHYFVDIFSSGVSKGTGILRLKELTGARELVAFGDNHNDLEMFRAADRAYAVENAVEDIKRAATGIIESCHDDGVAKFILKDI